MDLGKHIAFIVNPLSSGGRTAKLESEILDFANSHFADRYILVHTRYHRHAAELAQDLVSRVQILVAVGGDGTISQCAHGYILAEGAKKGVLFTFLPAGTGSDFGRTFNMTGRRLSELLTMLTNPKPTVVPIDAGKAVFSSTESLYYFINEASFGMTGTTVHQVSETWLAKVLTQKYIYLIMGFVVGLRYRCQPCRYSYVTEKGEKVEKNVSTLFGALCNGRYFGGNLLASPLSDPADGMLEFLQVQQIETILDRLFGVMLGLQDGSMINRVGDHKKAVSDRVSYVRAESEEVVYVEVDGEAVGQLPAEFSIVKQAVNLIISPPLSQSPTPRNTGTNQRPLLILAILFITFIIIFCLNKTML